MAEGQEPCDPEDQVVADGIEGEDEHLDRKALQEFGIARASSDHLGRSLTV